MSEHPSYESKVDDPKLKRSASHYQPAHGQAARCDIFEPCSTDNDSVSSGRTETTQSSAINDLKGLNVDQARIKWVVNQNLRVKVQDDSLIHPKERECYHLNERVEILDENGQEIGQALGHETSPAIKSGSVREHPFYKLKPDGNGQYYCPYTSLEDCWYRPQKLKSKFHEHLDTHLKPHGCNPPKCVDKHSSSMGRLLRRESAAHDIHGDGAKQYLTHSHNRFDQFEETTTPSFTKDPPNGVAGTHKLPDPSICPYVHSFQDSDHFLRNESGDEEDVSDRMDEVHVLAPPATVWSRPASSKWVDNRRRERMESSALAVPPKSCTIPTKIYSEQSKEKTKVEVDKNFLLKLESKISNLESRVEECEGRPESPTNSSIFDSQGSIDSISDLDHESVQEADAVPADRPCFTIARYKCFGGNRKVELFDKRMSSRDIGEDTDTRPLLALTEEYCSNGTFWRKQLAIASPAFYELLKDVSGHNLNDIALNDEVFHLTEPFIVLFLNRKQLAKYVETTSEFTQVKEQAKFILDFMKTDFGDVGRMLDNFESVTPPNLVRYCDLWMLYRPGTMMYSRANGEWEAFIIDSLDGMQVRKPSPDKYHSLTRLDVRAWSMNFDGEIYGRVWSIHSVAPFHGVRDISSLPIVPDSFLPDREVVIESLLSRGRKFCTLHLKHCQASEISPAQCNYVMVDHLAYQRRNGWLISIDGKYGPSGAKERPWTDNNYSDWDTSAEAFDRRPRRYTPYRSLVRHFENEYCNRDYVLESIDTPEDTQAEACRRYSTDRPSHVVVPWFENYNLIKSSAEMDELSMILCPQHVRAFDLRDKLWKFHNVSELEPASFQGNAWDRLVLDEEYKDLLETMVSSHADKVSGLSGSAAGKGLSILLHGEPGVGKSLTAESIAERFSKPLFPVTCSDIGTSVPKFDEKLEEIADYATEWGAILLLDEADVLLQARRDYECSNLKRNDLVSSFVRFLEYYQGIVIITTNRVSRFDGALMPRIDLTLGLPSLDRGRRVSIWCNQIQDLLDDGTINASDFTDLCTFVRDQWSQDDLNGHQIKKVIKTAKIMAEKKGKGLGYGKVQTVLKMEREFQERIGSWEKKEKEEEKEQKVARKKDNGDLEGFEQVEKP